MTASHSSLEEQLVEETDSTLLLQDAFARFNEASQVLQGKYDDLRQEVESLRAQLEEKNAEIRRAEKLSLLGKTAAAIAHEVRNPLGAMKLFVSVLREEVAGNTNAIEFVSEIDKSITALNLVVSNILQFAREKDLPMAPLNVSALVQECSTALEAQHPQLSVTIEHDGQVFIVGNECALRQMISNLLRNAAQAMNFSGEIQAGISPRGEKEIALTVADHGPGIPAEVLGSLFEPFVTTKNEGTGLGLSVSKQIIVQHGGCIVAYNDNGAVFEVVLPRQGAH